MERFDYVETVKRMTESMNDLRDALSLANWYFERLQADLDRLQAGTEEAM